MKPEQVMSDLELPNPETGGSIHPVNHYSCVASEGCRANPGLTIRDYFAAKALQGILSGPHLVDERWDHICQRAFNCADAMLEARKK